MILCPSKVDKYVYDGAAQKVAYTYDDLGRVTTRTAECGNTAGKLTSSHSLLAAFYAARQSVCFSISVRTPRLRWTRLVL